jgi:hypothetical protein
LQQADLTACNNRPSSSAQVKALSEKLDGHGTAEGSSSDGSGSNGSRTDGSESRSPGNAKISQSHRDQQQGSKHHE